MDMDLGNLLDRVRRTAPLVQCITNFVTVNDCANIILAAGGSPTMAEDVREVEETAAAAQALVCNFGPIEKTPAMVLAGKSANRAGRPVVLDPVAAGSTAIRRQESARLLEEVRFSVIRGNASEIRALARRTGAVVAVSGPIAVVSDGARTAVIRNGCATMARITGSGCMLSALLGAFCGGAPDQIFGTTCAAVAAMGVAGELAEARRLKNGTGNATFRTDLIDAVFNLTEECLQKGVRYEIYQG